MVGTAPLARVYGSALAYRLFHPPHRGHHRHPRDLGLPATELRVPFAPGRSLHAWLCRGDPDRVVVLGHPLGLSKSAALGHARFLHDAGYTVCLFDHRNHGASSTDRAWRAMADRFTDDITGLVRHLRQVEWYDQAQIAVYGFSFSTFPSVYALAREGCTVSAVVCDSGPGPDVPLLLRNFLDADALPTPPPFRAPPARTAMADALCATGTAMLDASWPPPPGGRYATTPLLFLAGGRDTVIPADQVTALADRYPLAESRVLPDAGHLDGLKTAPVAYPAAVLGFLKRALAAPGLSRPALP